MPKQDYITEGQARFHIPALPQTPTADMPVFYNPIMETNRTISIDILNTIIKKPMHMLFPLSGSGIRPIRFALELKKNSIASLTLNDLNKEAIASIQKNWKQNNITLALETHNKEASQFLLAQKGGDYIDIDPFGSPVPFLDAALKRMSRNGILAITATDTAPLCGTYPLTCQRRYDATPLRCSMMHELGLRILIRKVQTIASQYDKNAQPILSYAHQHYFRVFFKITKSKEKSNANYLLHKHLYMHPKSGYYTFESNKTCPHTKEQLQQVGPLYTGSLHDEKIIEKIKSNQKIIERIKDEVQTNNIFGFYDNSVLCKNLGLPQAIKTKELIKRIQHKGFVASGTHINQQAIKTDMPYTKILTLIKQETKKIQLKK